MGNIAFFDVDETLLSFKSMVSFLEYLTTDAREPLLDPARVHVFKQHAARAGHDAISRERLNALYYEQFANAAVAEIAELGMRWYARTRRTYADSFFHEPVLEALHSHAAHGDEIVLLSGSFDGCLGSLKRELNVPRITTFFAQLDQRDARYTGRVLEPRTVGPGKAQIARAHASQRDVELERCYAYADDISDYALLELVGNPRVIAGCAALEDISHEKGWPTWHCQRRSA